MKRPKLVLTGLKPTAPKAPSIKASPELLSQMVHGLDLLNKKFAAIEMMMKVRAQLESMGIADEMEPLAALSVTALYKKAEAIKREQKEIEERRILMLKELGL